MSTLSNMHFESKRTIFMRNLFQEVSENYNINNNKIANKQSYPFNVGLLTSLSNLRFETVHNFTRLRFIHVDYKTKY